MKRCMVALDVQNYYHPAPGMVQQINQLATTMATAATVFTHNEGMVPLARLKRTPPGTDTTLVATNMVFEKHGYGLPDGLKVWLRSQAPDEVIVVGGHTDANVLAAGFDLFDMGFVTGIVPLLCYGNDWYMHTVTTKIWEAELGTVYQSVAELKFGTL